MALTELQKNLLRRYESSYSRGLTMRQASERRSNFGKSVALNTVDPPINCPKWVCCLLPCINHVPSMKQFRLVQPDDAEVLRDGRWIRYDHASLVLGDIIRLVEGDIVPADCVVISLGMEHADESLDVEGSTTRNSCDELTVDSHYITGEEKPRRIYEGIIGTDELAPLYYGSRVLEGACLGLVTATGEQVVLAKLIKAGRWPPKGDLTSEVKGEDGMGEDGGISLLQVTTTR